MTRWWLLAAVILLLAACGREDKGQAPSPLPATASPTAMSAFSEEQPRGLIAFTVSGAAYTVRPDGSGLVRALEVSAAPTPQPYKPGIIAASLSPDGSRLAFIRDYNVWVANVDGSEPRLVAEVARFDIPPPDMPRASRWSVGAVKLAWSPDGAHLVYLLSRLEGSGIQNLGLVALEEGEPQEVFQGSGAFIGTLAWSADGRIVFVECDNVVKLLSPDDGRIEQVVLPIEPDCTGRIALPQPGGDGWLVGTYGRLVDTDGRQGTFEETSIFRVREESVEEVAVGVQPIWSPHGSHIAYLHEGGLWVARADGSEASQIVDMRPLIRPDFVARGFLATGISLSWSKAVQ